MQKHLLFFAVTVVLALSSCVAEVRPEVGQLSIADIQGCARRSPYEGKDVQNIEGVVTHKFSNGFTIQAVSQDSRDCSSEAIFVETGDYPQVLVGQIVRIDATVVEYTPGNEEDHNLSLTELHNPRITVMESGMSLPDPVALGETSKPIPLNWVWHVQGFNIQENGLDYYESLEFMLVEVQDGVVVGPRNNYNEFFVLPTTLVDTNSMSQEGVLLESADDENPEKIMVNAAARFTREVNVGDRLLAPIVGIMDYAYGNYRIWTIKDPLIEAGEIVTSVVEKEKRELMLATYNLENFSRFDDPARIRKIGCQIAKNLNSPDVVILNEIMDDSGTQDDGTVRAERTLQALVEAIAACGGGEYAYSDNPPADGADGGIAGGNIRTVVIYRVETGLALETPAGLQEAVSDSGSQTPVRLFAGEAAFRGTRKPALWLFNWNGEQIFIVGVHLVSQTANTPAWGDAQPPERPEQAKREQQMQLIMGFMKEFLAQNPSAGLLLLGDFNDYPWSSTLRIALEDQLLVAPGNQPLGSDFTYLYDGNGFQFDYILASKPLAARIKLVSFPHLNTLFDAETRLSDHDPVVVTIGK